MAKKKTRKRVARRAPAKVKPHIVHGVGPASQFCSVYVMCRDRDEALKIAQTLVEEDLVACFNIFENITSVYKWKGELEKGSEVALIGKTRKELSEAIQARIRKLHSYAIPAIVFWPIVDGYNPYFQWVTENTRS